MSIGVVLSDEDMRPLESAYYVLAPEYMEGGLYSHALAHERAKDPIVCTRREAMQDILNMCLKHNVTRIFAYNALFDKSHLPEGVEPMLRILRQDWTYFETHNALLDAVDELEIMRRLGHTPEKYIKL